jgi:hypothetical protein
VLNDRVRGTRFTIEERNFDRGCTHAVTLAVAIQVATRHSRPKYFRPVIDIAKIVPMVAGQLVAGHGAARPVATRRLRLCCQGGR